MVLLLFLMVPIVYQTGYAVSSFDFRVCYIMAYLLENLGPSQVLPPHTQTTQSAHTSTTTPPSPLFPQQRKATGPSSPSKKHHYYQPSRDNRPRPTMFPRLENVSGYFVMRGSSCSTILGEGGRDTYDEWATTTLVILLLLPEQGTCCIHSHSG